MGSFFNGKLALIVGRCKLSNHHNRPPPEPIFARRQTCRCLRKYRSSRGLLWVVGPIVCTSKPTMREPSSRRFKSCFLRAAISPAQRRQSRAIGPGGMARQDEAIVAEYFGEQGASGWKQAGGGGKLGGAGSPGRLTGSRKAVLDQRRRRPRRIFALATSTATLARATSTTSSMKTSTSRG